MQIPIHSCTCSRLGWQIRPLGTVPENPMVASSCNDMAHVLEGISAQTKHVDPIEAISKARTKPRQQEDVMYYLEQNAWQRKSRKYVRLAYLF